MGCIEINPCNTPQCVSLTFQCSFIWKTLIRGQKFRFNWAFNLTVSNVICILLSNSNISVHLLRISEVLEGLVSTSKWPRNEAKFLASSRPRPRKTRIKSLVLKMAEKKAEIPRNSSSCPRKGRGKGKNSSPRLVLARWPLKNLWPRPPLASLSAPLQSDQELFAS